MEIVAKVRELCLALPEVTEGLDSFGHISFRVRDKPFVMMGEKDASSTLAIKTLPLTQELLLQREGFTKTPYIGQHGWVSLRTTGDLDWNEIQDLLLEGYLRTAPKRLAKLVLK
ncbi:MmcQ/YjbR family DNA-binding protein [Tumebacillus permanentifrigoris]|uniref:Putative DNA-binding protein (MmcQ/YjbR family) n=1 Tax=Tumebacillus permanentifrigoris TaxID=378543 RepID=A0A316D457_9BACL|nr:MmcQ/YjbR family DNA-binding protein [Tumebacillus permanentifrigoris]PWK07017.1 putative DNA-binding protein (MmcQ/YjbR family) [Tumebacillus permanentifrigoris]